MTRVAWVTGAADAADPAIGAALAAAGVTGVQRIDLGAAEPMTPLAVGVAGAVRVVVGDIDDQVVASANVDDLDPRVWPGVLAGLLAAGAADAWLTPILMKKGRPAHTVSALVDAALLPAVRDVLLTETTSIGVRVQPVRKTALDRAEAVISVRGHDIRVKVATDVGGVRNVMPEWDDVQAAAAAAGIPARRVLAEAQVAAAPLWTP